MARPLRLEFAGALYHIMSRGDNKQVIFKTDHDRNRFFRVYSEIYKRLNWTTYAWCLMDNHYHLVVETPGPTLSEGMRLLNGIYTQYFNHAHGRVGHLFQGRFHSIVVDKDSYLVELVRYVVLNPVRSGLVRQPEEWPWSSYRATAGLDICPEWLDADWVTDVVSDGAGSREQKIKQYRAFVEEGLQGKADLMDQVQQQIYLGDEDFVARVQEACEIGPHLAEVVREQKRKPLLQLDDYGRQFPSQKEAMARAYLSGHYSQAEIARHFGVHYSTVSKATSEYK